MENMIQLSEVKQVYSGKLNSCCCGCSGTYSEDKNSRLFQKIMKMFKETDLLNPNAVEILDGLGDETIFTIETETRMYIVYVEFPKHAVLQRMA